MWRALVLGALLRFNFMVKYVVPILSRRTTTLEKINLKCIIYIFVSGSSEAFKMRMTKHFSDDRRWYFFFLFFFASHLHEIIFLVVDR